MKLQILVVAFVLAGCGGESFRGFSSAPDTDGGLGGAPAEVDAGGNGGAVDSDSGSGGASGGSGGTSASTGGSPVATGGSSSGGAPASTGGVPGSGGVVNAAVCCVFPLTSGPKTSSCDIAAPWFCTGGQTYSCAQPGQCTLGMPCYFATGPFGGTVEPCSACDTPVTHDNGNQQIWQDCVPLGTHNKDQATKACKAANAVQCVESTRCGPTVYEVQGFDADGYVIGEWGYGGFAAGLVSLDFDLCSPGDPGRRQWR